MPVSRPTAATYAVESPVDVTRFTEDGQVRWTEDSVERFIDLATSLATASETAVSCIYRDRMVQIDSTDTNAVTMSRQGDYDDYEYGKDVGDAGRAFFFQLSEAGEVGEAVTALVPHRDAFLLAATANTLWIVRGDPAAGGGLSNLSRNVGIVSSAAWAKVDESVVFLANDGIYMVQANGGFPVSLSEDRIPQELLDVDSAVLGYSHDENGVYIFAATDETTESWFFDLVNKGFWPMDDATPAESHLLIGPLPMAGPGSFGRVVSLHGALGLGSGEVTWRIVTGDTAEEAVENAKTAIGLYQAGSTAAAAAYAASSGTLTAGRSHMSYPRTRAVWIVIWLQAASQWAYEGIILETAQSGRWR